MHDVQNNNIPAYFANKFHKRHQCRERVLRNNNNFNVPRATTLIRKRSITVTGPTAWNSLPHDQQLLPKKTFKRKLKKMLVSTY